MREPDHKKKDSIISRKDLTSPSVESSYIGLDPKALPTPFKRFAQGLVEFNNTEGKINATREVRKKKKDKKKSSDSSVDSTIDSNSICSISEVSSSNSTKSAPKKEKTEVSTKMTKHNYLIIGVIEE